jgi:hypothetical protein
MCPRCKLPLEGAIVVAGEHAAARYRPHVAPIIATLRGIAALSVLGAVGPLIVALTDRDRAVTVFGAATGARLWQAGAQQQPVVSPAVLALGGLLAWSVIAFVVRWYAGRAVLFVLHGMSLLLVVLAGAPDLSLPGVEVQLFGALLLVTALGYSVVRPQ